MTPFKVVYGRDPPSLLRMNSGQTAISSLEKMLQDRDAILDDLQYNLTCARQKMKMYADGRRRDEQFMVGDKVYLRIQPYRQRSLAKRPFEKLAAKFYGPFVIIQRIRAVAYKLQLPTTSKIHPIFHVSLLRRVVGNVAVSPTILEQLNTDMELVVEPELLLAVRHWGRISTGHLEVLLKWKGLPEFEATWEDFNLHLWEEGNVIPCVMQPKALVTYNRKKQKGKEVNSKVGKKVIFCYKGKVK